MSYLKIKYRNSCDLAGSVFQKPQNTFFYVMYLNTDPGKPTYEFIDEGREDGEKNFIPDFRKLTKKYEFTIVVPEYQFDALASIMLHDTVFITLKNGESNRVYNFMVTPAGWTTENGNMLQLTISYTVRYDIATGCCGNEAIKYMPCLSCKDLDVQAWFYNFTVPVSSDRQLFMIGTQSGGEIINNVLYQYSYSLGWIEQNYPVNTLICFTLSGIDYLFLFDGQYWQPARVIRSAVASGTTVRVKGYMLPGLFAQLYISTDDITYNAVGNPVNDGTMYNAGVVATGLTLGTPYYFKFRMYNNNCDYSYSDTVTVTP